jgi:hypothetical protein
MADSGIDGRHAMRKGPEWQGASGDLDPVVPKAVRERSARQMAGASVERQLRAGEVWRHKMPEQAFEATCIDCGLVMHNGGAAASRVRASRHVMRIVHVEHSALIPAERD